MDEDSDLPPPARSPAVEYTISEDHGEGHAAHAQSGFAMLAAGDAALPRQDPRNWALQDYQMQLMLLEQQNRKRLMMARRDQDLEEKLYADRPRSLVLEVPEPQASHDHDHALEEDNATERQGPAPEATDPAGLHQGDDLGLHYATLYRVVCSSSRAGCEGRVYQFPPTNTLLIQVELHLGGDGHALDVSALLKARSPPVAFIVYRPVYCPHANPASPSPAGLEPHGEVISVVSPELQAIMQQISKFTPDDNAYSSSHVWKPRVPGALLSQSPSEYSPYFLYHHRDALLEAASATAAPSLPQVKALLLYLQHFPDTMWSKCNELFAQGRVSAETLPWLFQPNEVVLCKDRQQDMAVVLRRPPKWTASHSVSLDCWNWGYDGQFLRRKEKRIALTAPTYDTVPITDLAAYPLRYADEETRARLLERGSKFWKLRNLIHVAYHGPDYQGERVYVSCVFRMLHTISRLTPCRTALGLAVHDRLPGLPQVPRQRRRLHVP
jgi:hypothetical protein